MNVYITHEWALQEEKVFRAQDRSFSGLVKLTSNEVVEFYLSRKEGFHLKRGIYPLEWEEDSSLTNSELFAAEFNALKSEHQDELKKLNLAFASAALVDGVNQVDKQAQIRAAYNVAISENQAAVNALMVKYYE